MEADSEHTAASFSHPCNLPAEARKTVNHKQKGKMKIRSIMGAGILMCCAGMVFGQTTVGHLSQATTTVTASPDGKVITIFTDSYGTYEDGLRIKAEDDAAMRASASALLANEAPLGGVGPMIPACIYDFEVQYWHVPAGQDSWTWQQSDQQSCSVTVSNNVPNYGDIQRWGTCQLADSSTNYGSIYYCTYYYAGQEALTTKPMTVGMCQVFSYYGTPSDDFVIPCNFNMCRWKVISYCSGGTLIFIVDRKCFGLP